MQLCRSLSPNLCVERVKWGWPGIAWAGNDDLQWQVLSLAHMQSILSISV
jgi:hypothetical protein